MNHLKKAISRKLETFKTHYKDDFRAFLWKAKPIFGIFNIFGRIVFKKYKGCAFFYKIINSSMEKDFMSCDLSFSIDKDVFSNSIKDILRIKHFNKLKEFSIHLYSNNLYLNTRSYKWDNEKGNMCLRIHIFQTWSTTKDLQAFLEWIMTSVGHLQSGNTKYLFLYEIYKANSL